MSYFPGVAGALWRHEKDGIVAARRGVFGGFVRQREMDNPLTIDARHRGHPPRFCGPDWFWMNAAIVTLCLVQICSGREGVDGLAEQCAPPHFQLPESRFMLHLSMKLILRRVVMILAFLSVIGC